MVRRNPHLAKLHSGYLFPEINKRKQAFLAKNPGVNLISLGIGDTTVPLPPYISQKMQHYAQALATHAGYSGYGLEQGNFVLRQRIAEVLYQNKLSADELYVSDGAKCDIGRLQMLFGSDVTIAVQDPTYPVYVDTGVVMGQTGNYDASHTHYKGITYMPCTPENAFWPDFKKVSRTDLIYICSPNNPTGSTATRAQLTDLVAFAKRNRSIIVFDAAYSVFIRNEKLPRSIYEIPGAREVAIELGSFSKMIGFTGVRLAWSIIPKELQFDDGTPVKKDWHRINTTFFNGASNIAQHGGMAVLDPEGIEAMQEMTEYYLTNAKMIKEGLKNLGFAVYGGENAPYIWTKLENWNSWDLFSELLEKAHVVTTPGSGFGPAGEGFLRLSAFGLRGQVIEAMDRLSRFLSTELVA